LRFNRRSSESFYIPVKYYLLSEFITPVASVVLECVEHEASSKYHLINTINKISIEADDDGKIKVV
jgi:hypothetical protein